MNIHVTLFEYEKSLPGEEKLVAVAYSDYYMLE